MFYRLASIFTLAAITGFAEVREINAQNFDREIRSGKVLADFYGPWCPPCKQLSPVLDQLSDEMDGKVTFIKINTDKAPDLTQSYAVRGLPTLILFENGKEKGRSVGFRNKEAIKRFIETGKAS